MIEQDSDKECRDEDASLHSSWRVALYYIYIDLDTQMVTDQLKFHTALCQKMDFKGRIRISNEGLNGVLTGLFSRLKEYELLVTKSLQDVLGASEKVELDVKYCLLRNDLSIESQLFDSLVVKETKSVIGLFDDALVAAMSRGTGRKGASSCSSRRRRQQAAASHEKEQQRISEDTILGLKNAQEDMLKYSPSPHLSAEEWNERLRNEPNALLLDVRNVYESRVGHFTAPTVPTLLTNTRKYSDLPQLLLESPHIQDKEEIFMYCTGGVRCERVSMLVQSMYPDKKVYQLKGGIQSYLREMEENKNVTKKNESLFQGKNFVFDPRRTDPVNSGVVVGRCLVCQAPHDDYDNGHAPSQKKEARCNSCRMLVLVCNTCRQQYQCWGERLPEDEETKPPLYCGLDKCVHEGAAPTPELLQASHI